LNVNQQDLDLAGLRVLATTEYPYWMSCGGTDHVVWQVASRMAAWGATVTLCTGLPANAPGRTLSETVDGVRILGLASSDIGRWFGVELSVARSGAAEVRRLLLSGCFDVVYANGLYFPVTAQATWASVRTGVPIVTAAHVGRVEGLPRYLKLATSAYERAAVRWILKKSRAVVAVAEGVKREVLRLSPGAVVHVIPNGVAKSFRELDHAGNHDIDVLNVAFIGRLIQNKGPHLLVDALASMRRNKQRVFATFVGDGPMRKELERRVQLAGLRNDVRFTGHVTDVGPFLRAADVFVRPSTSEGLPLAVLEAMAAGVCVIASDIPGNSDLIDHNRNGLLVRVHDTNGLAAGLTRLANAPDLRRHLAAEARATAETYSWERTAKQTACLLLAVQSKEAAA
jgi:glycosyltransferase involved in cell wall biosynthesis